MNKISDFYFNEGPDVICGEEVPSIINDFVEDCPSVIDRFFTRFYYRKPGTTEEDHLVLFHSNRICLIGLAERHIARQKGVSKINFDIGNIDRSQNQCSGKGKKGAMNLQPSSALAIVTCADGSEYKVLSCVTGKLIEVNMRLLDRPGLAEQEGDGYVAVCLPKPENCEAIKADLLTKEQYLELIGRDDLDESNGAGVIELVEKNNGSLP